MRFAVHGASGFTGSLIVTELVRRDLTPVLVGRDAERLHRVAERAGRPDAEVRVAALDDIDALATAFADTDVVVNAAGPFTLWGEPVVRAALAAARPYLDTTGEPAYLHKILSTYDEPAKNAGVAVIPAITDDGLPGDLIAALTAAHLHAPIQEMVIADLRRPGAASRGTARSMAAIMVLDQVEYRDRAWQSVHVADTTLTEPGEPDPVPVSALALPGVYTIPRHVDTPHVRGVIRGEAAALFASLTAEVAETLPEIPDSDALATSKWFMLAEATALDGRRARGWVTGFDPYGSTAVIAVEAARRLATDGAPAGTLAAAQAFDAASFLDHLATTGVKWQVEELPARN
ncbi:saccharopine dehydrogenase NADP-binding domain-containing protein [Nocardia sp. CDC153]|uniref:saccharopine dehydrogenase NADP-binding domain-containing protein n=1 Tax=Nocardia sp. CDC153 TaxID=3112167 RepID=UPI002DBEB0CA|nr:saccharopine dehydrogenase NADP-binding domain-containing protein [Nocardia sp. CDC153]MEC3956646.1 saccharopine dehydrogenase NADP-binding domain-containing protein [Nocardia sp. CDC153]